MGYGQLKAFLSSVRQPGGPLRLQPQLLGMQDSPSETKFTLKSGRIFEDSALGLNKWLLAIWLIANAKHDIGSHELARKIGVTQRTAWLMLQRIGLALMPDP
jgi:hypothetical protein